jgi:N-acetylmuramoyl-L-alanine amidase
VADLQRRLVAIGQASVDDAGDFGPSTTGAVVAFQASRGLREDGICGDQTWAAIVEAGYRLGDRRLYQRKPMTRGDDVADLQRRLAALGFDAGKVDGIFGPDTAGALADFQRNAGLTVDGIFGPDELQVLERLSGRPGGDSETLVVDLRELAGLRWSARTLEQLRVVIGERGGLDAIATSLGRLLARHGADTLVLHHPDGSELAQQANRASAEVFVELGSLGAESGCRCTFYQGYRTTSRAGADLARALQHRVPAALGVPALGACGMAIPVLRETRMPAVVCEAGPTAALVERGPAFAGAIIDALATWVSVPAQGN